MTSPGISIVTPVLNEVRTLTETLESVGNQSIYPKEHIIVDSGSTDGSLDIIRRYAATAPYPVRLLNTPAEGVYAALNAGNAAATGEIIGLLHGDDAFSSHHVLEFVCSAMARDTQTELIYGDVHYVNSRGQRTRYYSGAHFRPGTLLSGFAFPHPSMYIRRRLWERIGGYDTRFRIAGDYEWIVRATLKNNAHITYLPLDMVAMHEGGLAFQWNNRLMHNISEKRRALRLNGYKAPLWRMMGRYLYLFKH